MRVRTPLRIKFKQHIVRNAQAWLAIVFAAIVGAASVAAASSYSKEISVDRYQGQPVVLRNGFELPITVGMKLRRGDRIVTDTNSRLAIDMGPDSMLMMGSDSEIALTALHVSGKNDGGIKAVVELPRGVARFITPSKSVDRPRRIRMVLGEAKFRIGKTVTDAWFKHAEPTNVGCLFDGALEVFVGDEKVADVGDPRFCFLHNIESEELPVRVIDEGQQRSLLAQTDIRPSSVVVSAPPQREVAAIDASGQPKLPPIVPAKPALRKPVKEPIQVAAAEPEKFELTKPVKPKISTSKPMLSLPHTTPAESKPKEVLKPSKLEPQPVAKPKVKAPVKPVRRQQVAPVRTAKVTKPRYTPPRNIRNTRVQAKAFTPKQRENRMRIARAAAEALARKREYEFSLYQEYAQREVVPSVVVQPEYQQQASPTVSAIISGPASPTFTNTDVPVTADLLASILEKQWRIDGVWDGEKATLDNVPKPRKPQAKVVRPINTEARPKTIKPVPKRSSAKGEKWHVNIASYGQLVLAKRLAGQLQILDVPADVMPIKVKGKTYYRVYVQVVGKKADAARAGKALVGMFGVKNFWLKRQ